MNERDTSRFREASRFNFRIEKTLYHPSLPKPAFSWQTTNLYLLIRMKETPADSGRPTD
jgi:hypothetical protein